MAPRPIQAVSSHGHIFAIARLIRTFQENPCILAPFFSTVDLIPYNSLNCNGPEPFLQPDDLDTEGESDDGL